MFRHKTFLILVSFLLVLGLALWVSCGGNAAPGTQQPQPQPQPQPPVLPPQPAPQPATEPDFTLVLLPDTQYYAEESRGASMEMLRAEMRWIADNKDSQQIRAVIGLGDLVQCNQGAQWANTDSAYDILDAAGVPYLPLIGNHDYDGDCGSVPASRAATAYNAHFGRARLSGRPWYGASSWPQGGNENHYITFQNGDTKYLVLGLEFYPRAAALEWAQGVLNANPDHLVIVATHAFVDVDNTRITDNESRGPVTYGLTADNSGEELWQGFIRRNAQIIAVVNGHLHGVGRLTEDNDGGRKVPQMLSNYQEYEHGGDGYLRIWRVRPSSKTIEVLTYSPFLNQSYTDPANQFSVTYE